MTDNLTVLITGCKGQLGKCIVDLEPTCENVKFINTDIDELDITDYDKVYDFIKKHNINFVVNCAANVDFNDCEEHPDESMVTNAYGPLNLAMAVNKCSNGYMIHISSDYVFDGKQSVPCSENDPAYPLSVYGKAKILSEQMVRYACKKSFILRTAWLYSEYGNNFVKTMKKMLNIKDSVSVVFDQVGSPTYARDLAGVIIDIIKNIDTYDSSIYGVYHYSNEGVTSWYDFTKHIQNFYNIDCEVIPIHSDEFPTKASRPHYSVLDKTKIKNKLNVKIPYWYDSLQKCLINIKGES